jgi:hypothetical protein
MAYVRALPQAGSTEAPFFRGLSGAPVWTAGGTLLGAVSATPGLTGDNVMAVRALAPGWQARAQAAREQRCRADGEHWIEFDVGTPPREGDVIFALAAWGDLAVGTSGRITQVDGTSVALLGHAYEGASHGPCVVALFAGSGLAVCEYDRNDYLQLVNPDALIGVLVYSGQAGCIALLGLRPAIAELHWTVVADAGQCLDERRIQLVADMSESASASAQVLGALYESLLTFDACVLTVEVVVTSPNQEAPESAIATATLGPGDLDAWWSGFRDWWMHLAPIDTSIEVRVRVTDPPPIAGGARGV